MGKGLDLGRRSLLVYNIVAPRLPNPLHRGKQRLSNVMQ